MAPGNEIKEEKHQQHDTISLRHERRRIRNMKLIFGMFCAVLLLSLILSLVLSR
jgi:predicted nucleic acid-binding Zn ribbon protein